MKKPSLALAFTASFAAAVVFAVSAMPPANIISKAEAQEKLLLAQAQGGTSQRRSDREPRERRERDVYADCHRDVRTHRINGVMVTHRHVGPNCDVRVVTRSSQPLPE